MDLDIDFDLPDGCISGDGCMDPAALVALLGVSIVVIAGAGVMQAMSFIPVACAVVFGVLGILILAKKRKKDDEHSHWVRNTLGTLCIVVACLSGAYGLQEWHITYEAQQEAQKAREAAERAEEQRVEEENKRIGYWGRAKRAMFGASEDEKAEDE